MSKISVVSKILLVLALCVPQSLTPTAAYVSKFAALKRYAARLPRPQFKAPTFKAMKLLSKSVAKVVKENGEDMTALSVILTIGCLAYKYWASDDQIKERYAKIMTSAGLKQMAAEQQCDISRLKFPSYTAAHMPDFASDDEEPTELLKEQGCSFKQKIKRGLFWDSHEIVVDDPSETLERETREAVQKEEQERKEKEEKARDADLKAKRAFAERNPQDPLAKRYNKPPEEYAGNWRGLGL